MWGIKIVFRIRDRIIPVRWNLTKSHKMLSEDREATFMNGKGQSDTSAACRSWERCWRHLFYDKTFIIQWPTIQIIMFQLSLVLMRRENVQLFGYEKFLVYRTITFGLLEKMPSLITHAVTTNILPCQCLIQHWLNSQKLRWARE